ncbi:MAG: hypothetical protein ACE5JU_19250 [Candidatus Binatia bacterium]
MDHATTIFNRGGKGFVVRQMHWQGRRAYGSHNGIMLTSVCRHRLVLEDLDKLLERHENRRRCRRFQERDMLTSILSRERN